jgi:hypothetical protein
LHVLNPLTNSDIIGNVNYYLVKPFEKKSELVIDIPILPQIHESDKVPGAMGEVAIQIDNIMTTPAEVDANKAEPLPGDLQRPNSLEPISNTNTNEAQEREKTLVSKRKTTKRFSMIGIPSEQVPQLNEIRLEPENIECIVKTHNVAFEEDTDKPIIPLAIAKLARKFSTSQNAPVSIDMKNSSFMESPATIHAKKKNVKVDLKITTKLPSGALIIGAAPTAAKVVPGTLTRFTVPVPKDEIASIVPKTQLRNRRTLSYRNAVSASGVPASFLEWTRMIQEDKQKLSSTPIVGNEFDFDKVIPFSSPVDSFQSTAGIFQLSPPTGVFQPSPTRLAPIQDVHEENDENEENQEKVGISAIESQETAQIVFYDAYYIANDNDFLETSKIRQIFKSNAIQPEDAKLFEMKEFKGEDEADNSFQIVGEAFPCQSCYPSEQEMRSMSRPVRFLHVHKCILLAATISILVTVFILVMIMTNVTVKDV